MKLFSTLAVALVTSTALVTGASATDLLLPEYDEMAAPAGFDWDGFYAGVGVAADQYDTGILINGFNIQGIAGFNIVSGDLLFGVEGMLEYYWDDFPNEGLVVSGQGRIGALVSEEVLVYGAAGLLHFVEGGANYGTASLGAEFAVTDNSTIDVKYTYLAQTSGTNTAHKFGASWNWYVD